MTVRCHLQLSWIVFLAIAAMSSMAGDAMAGVSGAAVKTGTRNCCVGRRCTPGCCKLAGRTSPARPANVLSVMASASDQAGISAPAGPCECLSKEPNAPASKSEPRTSESRPDRVQGDSVISTIETTSAAAMFARFVPHTSHAPEEPLYLRTSRLLI
jgi:hypothetical protein